MATKKKIDEGIVLISTLLPKKKSSIKEVSPLFRGDLIKQKTKFEDAVKDAGFMLYFMYKSAKSYGIDEQKFKILLNKFDQSYREIKDLLDSIK